MKATIALLGALLLSGCQISGPEIGENDPKYSSWELVFVEPNYMKVWVEDSSVQDVNDKVFFKAGKRTAASEEPDISTESARGWGAVTGSGMPVTGADLPKHISVRWQSITEQKTYRGFIDIPEEARRLMVTSTHQRCPETPAKTARFMASLYIGLAPGGVLQAWVKDSCRNPIKVARGQGKIEPLGAQQGKNGGRYAYPVSEKAKLYVEKYGVPYGSW